MKQYDESDPESIERFAQRLLGTTLREVVGAKTAGRFKGKGRLGQLVEESFFGYKPNSTSEPDFPKAGVELKTSPLKVINSKLVSKERLVLNIIDYIAEVNKTFETSSFWKKNRLLLLLFYLHDSSKIDIDLIFRICRLWEYPEEDLKIIKDDWLKIVTKVRKGEAHLLSEADTLYLAACTKGATAATSLRSQPYSPDPAKQRAFSLKSKYLNFIIDDSLKRQSELAMKNPDDYRKGQTFEDFVVERFAQFYGDSPPEIAAKLGAELSDSKHNYYLLARAILGIQKDRIAEFEKANVELKTIRLKRNGVPKESMSFKQIQFLEIVQETWENSYWLETLTKRFFFVVFQLDRFGKLRLKKAFFWAMPVKDLEVARRFWEDTRREIAKGRHEDFIKESDNRICHVRPKGRDSSDRMLAPSGRKEKKMAYWLNSSYIGQLVRSAE